MGLTAKVVSANLDRIQQMVSLDPRLPALQGLAKEVQDSGAEGKALVKAWQEMEKKADEIHAADLLPGVVGIRFRKLYASTSQPGPKPADPPQSDSQPGPPPVEVAEPEPVVVESGVVETPDVVEAESFVHPEPMWDDEPVAEAVPAEPQVFAEPEQDANGHPDDTLEKLMEEAGPKVVTVLLAPASIAVMEVIAAQFKNADNVPYKVEAGVIEVKEPDVPKARKLLEHLQENSSSITSPGQESLVETTLAEVLKGLA